MNFKKIKIKKLTLIISIFFLIVDVISAYLYYNYAQSYVNSRICKSADAAVVFFAGFDDKLNIDALQKSRLNKSIELFTQNKAKYIICVGGNRSKQQLYGSIKSKYYLMENGIPEDKIFYDTSSYDTKTNLVQAHQIANINNLKSLIYVSDPIHLHRISMFSNNANCLQQIDYPFNLIEVIRMSNQTYLSFMLEKLLSEDDYLALIKVFRN
jgi:uncharacterized SAM-binding protein YcdF (DUF218 family)